LLAIFPNFISKLPKSGGWLNTVKIFFAFFLLQFSLVFIVNLGLSFITREVILSVLIVMLFLLGMNILGKLRLAHDTPLENVSVTRLFIAILIFSLALYLTTGLFGAPLKKISPFLPAKSSLTGLMTSHPGRSFVLRNADNEGSTGICDENPKYSDILELPLGLKGYFDYNEALACAGKLNKPVLLDFAGHSCKNCKKMYAEVWSDTKVLNKLKTEFIVAALYTDDRTKLPEDEWIISTIDGKVKNTIGKKFNDLQITKFNSNALPLYAIVDAQGKILTLEKYYTYSPDIEGFLKFLEEGIKYSAN
jgi:thiol:disulfide interchange protein DsbD